MDYKKRVYLNGMAGEQLGPDDFLAPADELPEEMERLNYRSKFQSADHSFYLPVLCLEYADDYYNFKVRKSDVFVLGFPKSGTTWMQDIVWTLLHNPDLNNSVALSLPIYARSPYFEDDAVLVHLAQRDGLKNPFIEKFNRDCPDGDPMRGFFLQLFETYEDPRIMKSHLSLSFFRKEMLDCAKFVYTYRDPKSLLPSFYDFFKMINVFQVKGTFDEFVSYFLKNECLFGSYWDQIDVVWNLRNHPNVHFVVYQDLVDNTKEELKKLSHFLDLELTEAQLENIQHWCSFAQMKKRAIEHNQDLTEVLGHYDKDEVKIKGKFYRKGTGKDWKEVLTNEQIRRVDDWIEENIKKFGPNFPKPQE